MLRLEGVDAGYGRTRVLYGVDLVVPAGSTVALLGANGAGKTTLLRVAAGLLPATRGRVVLGDRTVEREAAYARSRDGLCLIPEGRGIFRQLTVRENLAMYANSQPVAAAIDRAMAAFPVLGERLSQQAGTLSGGQQQMLAVSRALIGEAPLILADELSVGLAPVIVDEIFAALEKLRTEGRSILVVEQYVDRALTVADYVYILHKGRVVFVGEPEQCRDRRVFDRYLGSVA
ncbi:MAG: ABC transporter ATP-binding protein [Actinobacteria bacterium]|nr:ABC transporter ATP-binding protein [Actinomycetota bacterium]